MQLSGSMCLSNFGQPLNLFVTLNAASSPDEIGILIFEFSKKNQTDGRTKGFTIECRN
jgi:hypothetical protein